MSISTRQRKWLKILLVLLIVIAAIGTGLLYVVNYRLRDVLQLIVDKESKGVYGFDDSSIDISLLKRNIVIKNAVLFCRDTQNTSPHFEVKIPQIYFAIQSWRELIFDKKISVDSLSVLNPEIKSHEHFSKKSKPVSFQTSDITENVQKLLLKLQVRSFHIQNASFVFSRLGNPNPLTVNRVDFSIKNFSKKTPGNERLFSSDDIDLSIGAQHWVLPDGNHEINFKKLHFSGKNQFFELDSCTFRAAPVVDKGEMTFSAEKLFFNSKQLRALYTQDALLLDTLICYKPVLNVETTTKNNKQADTTVAVSQSIGQFFTSIHINYIDVKDGEFSVVNKYKPNYHTQKANLTAYNLHINHDSTPEIKTDSIRLNLKDLAFLTTDSLFQLTVSEFSLSNKGVIFKKAAYAPTARNHADKGFSFTTPSLHLKNINLAALMNKQLMADTAELNTPVITVYDKSKTKNRIGNDSSAAPVKAATAKKKSFYQTLHGLSELIAVRHFNIINGSLGYTASGIAPVKMNMKNLNASILLSKLFNSDSLIDIKRSLPEVSATLVAVQTPKLKISVFNYNFKGDRRHNQADQFQLSLANGTDIKGTGLYWEVLDWDMYANHKIIQIDYLKLHELSVNISKKEQQGEAEKKNTKDLPMLNIARFDMDLLNFSDSSAKNTIRFNASDICVDNIGSKRKFFTWNNAEGLFKNFNVNAVNTKNISLGKINFNTQYGTVVQQAKIDLKNDNGYTKIDLPVAKIKTDIHSTDFSSIHLNLVEADNAAIDILKKQGQKNEAAVSKPLVIPVALTTDKILIKKATVKYTGETFKDTLQFTTGISIDASDVNTFKKQKDLFNYGKVAIAFSDLKIDKGNLELAVPGSSIALTNGSAEKNTVDKIILRSGVLVKWIDAKMRLKQTDTTGIIAHNFTGSFDDASFVLNPGTKIKWQSLAHKATITDGGGTYNGKNITITAGAIGWNKKPDVVSLRSFSVLPKLSMKETFSKPGALQGDYMTISGDAIDITGIRFREQDGDSMLFIKKIVLDSVSLTTTRDKRMPFNHNGEKPMPVVLINSVKMPLKTDSIIIKRSKVTVNEIAIKSEKQGTVPLNNINAVITNFKNRGNSNDSLTVVANASLINYKVSNFLYKEAYGDSLSYFYAKVQVSSMALPEFSTVTIPLASVGVDKGNADTLFARWVGNKYAAVGRMDFYYKGLKIRLLDAKDNSKKKFLLTLANSVAGLILRKNNDETSEMFFVRDREKFIFNYWVKTMLAGLSTSAGIKRNKKMLKNYNSVKTQYSLPVLYD